MSQCRVQVSAGAILLSAIVFYIGDPASVTAVLLAIIAHETGHILVMALLGLPIRGLRLELRGFCIEYEGTTGAVGHALVAAAGPAAGLLYALIASELGSRLAFDWLYLSAGTSLLLSLFNLLPALPLDGGRILLSISCALLGDRRGRTVTERMGLLIGMAILFLGIYLAIKGLGAAILIAAIWLLLYQESGLGIVKLREMI